MELASGNSSSLDAKFPKSILVIGDLHNASASAEVKSNSQSAGSGELCVERYTRKYAGATSLEAQMHSLAYDTFSRSYTSEETLDWNLVSSNALVPMFQVFGPMSQNEAGCGYDLSQHECYSSERYLIQRVSTDKIYNEQVFRRTSKREFSVVSGSDCIDPFRDTPIESTSKEKFCAALLEIDGLQFLRQPHHLERLVGSLESNARLIVKLRWQDSMMLTQGQGEGPSNVEPDLPEEIRKHLRVLLSQFGTRSVVILCADRLRRSGYHISRGLSWERTAQDAIRWLEAGKDMPWEGAQALVLSFSYEGLLIGIRDPESMHFAWTLVCDSQHIEGHLAESTAGDTSGRLSTIACSLAYHVGVGQPVSTEEICAATILGAKRGLIAARLSHMRGLTRTPQAGWSDKLDIKTQNLAFDFKRPLDPMAQVIRGAPIDQVTWVPNSSEAVKPVSHTGLWIQVDENRRLHRRLRRVTAMLDDIFDRANAVITCQIPPQATGDWSFLAQAASTRGESALGERSGASELSTFQVGMRHLAANVLVEGADSLKSAGVPQLRYGKFSSIIRPEMETYRELLQLIRDAARSHFKLHLNIGVFGDPGAGKTFAIKELIKYLADSQQGLPGVYELYREPIVKDVSQFASDEDFDQAIRDIANVSLSGKVPVVFWDEYDCNKGRDPFGWLQTFLEPMAARRYSSGPIGRSIFIFAGSRFASRSKINEANQISDGSYVIRTEDRVHIPEHELGKYYDFGKAKGRDFKSRLTFSVDVVGVNKSELNPYDEHLIKRAMIARSTLFEAFPQLGDPDRPHQGNLRIDKKVCDAILSDVDFIHGGRSLDTIIRASSCKDARFDSSHLPSEAQLQMHVRQVEIFESHYRRSGLFSRPFSG